MTPCRKPITRVSLETYHRGKQLVITIGPGDVVSMRYKRERKTFSAPLGFVHAQIIRLNVEAAISQKKKKRAVKRSLLA